MLEDDDTVLGLNAKAFSDQTNFPHLHKLTFRLSIFDASQGYSSELVGFDEITLQLQDSSLHLLRRFPLLRISCDVVRAKTSEFTDQDVHSVLQKLFSQLLDEGKLELNRNSIIDSSYASYL